MVLSVLLFIALPLAAGLVTRYRLGSEAAIETFQARVKPYSVFGLIVTVMLLVSSFYMYRAEVHMRHGNLQAFQTSILTTLILGVIFLLGVVAVEWQIAPFGPADGQEGAIFYVMTGFHAFHVLTGVIALWWVYNNSKRGVYTPEKHWGVGAAAVYWHFIDVVWIFFYPALYLIGTVA